VNVRRGDLEREFEDFLKGLQPKPEYLRLFSEIILDVWNQKQSRTAETRSAIARRLADLRQRKELLVEAFVYKKQLDQETYQEQLDKLTEEITFAQIEEKDAELQEIDVEAALAFAKYVLGNAARLWAESNPDQKQRLHQLLFPAGVQYSDGVYRTTATSSIFFELGTIADEKEGLVALPGIEPGFED
jgi:hypothetical protein